MLFGTIPRQLRVRIDLLFSTQDLAQQKILAAARLGDDGNENYDSEKVADQFGHKELQKRGEPT